MTNDSPPPSRPLPFFWWGLAFEIGLAVVAWGVGWLTDRSPSLRWNARETLVGFGACVPMLFCFFLFLRWPIGPLAKIKQFSDEIVRPLFAPCSDLQLLLLALSAGVGEEMLFRGLLQQAVVDWVGLWPGIAAVSVLFGLAHLITATYALLAGALGVYLSWVLLLANGNLLIVIVAHALYDAVALIYLVRGRPDDEA